MKKILYIITAVVVTFIVAVLVQANFSSSDLFYTVAAIATMGAFILAKPDFSEKEKEE